ncbi:hypothetical protein Jab_2c22940 [Janthinobacterium sp. HH01]|uniref:hypothetical protein n=1 Tax=Janthinobacterium sp. HH01 TaxID=1198452 RepID=UPI0002AE8B05|nr:hypothetical protein [Janthinobacterium sp. HH01]ELX10207.1 hypothetical protein Jab_2c22940 [Janthinobacterium sp. HH01]
MRYALGFSFIALTLCSLGAQSATQQPFKADVSKSFENKIKTESFLEDLFQKNKGPTSPSLPLNPTTIREELQQLFSSSDCPLPDKLKAEIVKGSPYGYLPDEINSSLNADGILATKPNKVPGASIQNVIHTIRVPAKPSDPSGTQAATDLILSSSDSYTTAGAESLINPNRSSFIYTMDCSGFLNAALSVNANLTVAEIQGTAKLATSTARSMFVARASIFTPVAIAIDPGLGSTAMTQSTRQRIDLLHAIAAEVYSLDSKALDTTPVTTWREMDLLWATNQGSTSLQGQGQISGSAAGGLGVVSMNLNTGSGGTFSRAVKFTSFNTYLLKSDVTKPVTASLGDLRVALTKLIGGVAASKLALVNDPSGQTATATFTMLTSKLCLSPWAVKPDTKDGPSVGSLTSTFSLDGGCLFSFSPIGTMPSGKIITLTLASSLASNDDHQFTLAMPILKQAP